MSWLPFLIDGLLLGATLALGAVGLTLTYSILGFANFTHGDLITWGAYFVLSLALVWAAAGGGGLGHIGPLSFGWPFLALRSEERRVGKGGRTWGMGEAR